MSGTLFVHIILASYVEFKFANCDKKEILPKILICREDVMMLKCDISGFHGV